MTRQRIEALLDKPITGALSVLMGLLFLASLFSSHVVGQVALVVSKTFMSNFYVWNIITGNLLETNILKLVPCIAGVLHFGSQAEKALGPIRYAQFLAVVLVGCGAAASAYVFLHFVLSRSETILFRPFHGPGGLVAGLAVAAALPPDPRAPPPPPPPPPPPRLLHLLPRAQLMPLVICGVWTLGAVLWIGCARDALFAWAGFYLGWAYLRFVDPRPDGAHGDTSRHFEVAAFFPEATRRFIQPLCNFCYGVMILLGFFKDRKVPLPKAFGAPGGGEVQHHSGAGGGDDDDDEEAAAAAAGGGFLGLDGPSAGGGGGGGGGLLPPARRADPASERRRARAMKLLDAKFAELAQREGEGAWGDEDGGISATTGQAGKHSEGLVGEDASSSSPPELITGISSTKNADDDEDGENWGLEEEGKHAAKVTPSSSG